MAIDPAAIEEYREILGDEFAAFFIDLIDSFFDSAPALLHDLSDGLASNDAARFERAAHTIKSNCKTFGAYEFADKAYELEQIGAAKDLSAAAPQIAELEQAYQELVLDLQQLRARLEG